MKPGVHERRWEVDSLCYVIRLAHGYWKATGDASVFDSQWQEAMRLIVKTFKEQQRKEGKGPYRFQRNTQVPTDTQYGGGWGNPTPKVGLIHSILTKTHVGTGFIHESFHVDNPKDFSRPWFAWANTIFGELILQLHRQKPELLKRKLD